MWTKIRRIPPETFKDLHHLLKTGINNRTSRGSKARLQKWASYFKLDNGSIILETDIPQPDMIDKSTGKPVLETQMKKYKVIYDPQQAEELIISYYLTPYAGGFRGVESIYRSISREIIGISRHQVAKALMRMESKQISHSANQSILQPIETTAVMQRLQIDLIDYSKSPLSKFNDNMNYILTCIDCFSKFVWAFPLKNKKMQVWLQILCNIYFVERGVGTYLCQIEGQSSKEPS